MVVESDPVADYPARVLQGLEAVAVGALLFQRPDHPLDHPVLPRGVRRNQFLPEPIGADQGSVTTAGDSQAIVGAQQEGGWYPAQRNKPGD